MGHNINPKLKAFVRVDGSGRVVPGTPVLQASKPKVGNWIEIPAYEGNVQTTTTTSTSSTTTTTSTSTSTTTTTTTSNLVYSILDLAFDRPGACANNGGNLNVGIPIGDTIATASTIYGNFASFAQPVGTTFYFRWAIGPTVYTRAFVTNAGNTSANAIESPVAC